MYEVHARLGSFEYGYTANGWQRCDFRGCIARLHFNETQAAVLVDRVRFCGDFDDVWVVEV